MINYLYDCKIVTIKFNSLEGEVFPLHLTIIVFLLKIIFPTPQGSYINNPRPSRELQTLQYLPDPAGVIY